MTIKLLRHPKPYDMESLGNYLFRLSTENIVPLDWLLKELNLPARKKAVSINRINDKPTIKLIAQVSNLSEENIERMTIHNFSLGLWQHDLPHCWNQNFLKRYVSNYSRLCPLCLKEASYHRIYWQLKSVRVCPKHRVIMEDKCCHCNQFFSADEVITGVCSCGAKLTDIKPRVLDNSIKTKGQRTIFDIYAKRDRSLPHPFNNLEKKNYLELYTFLFDLVHDNFENINNTNFEELYGKDIACLMHVERMLQDWPNSFLVLVNELNEIYKSRKTKQRNNQLFNPNQVIDIRAYQIKDVEILNVALLKNLLNNYDVEFFKQILNVSLEDGKYVGVGYAESILGINSKLINQIIPTVNINGANCVALEDIVSLVRYFIELGGKDSTNLEGYERLPNFLLALEFLNLKTQDFMDLVYSSEIGIKINAFNVGLNMVYLDSVKTKREMLLLALNKLNMS